MTSNMKKGLGVVAALGLGVIGFAAYMLRPLPEPTQTTNLNPLSFNTENENTKVYRINTEKSTAEFNIQEVLRGEDFLVVGTTNNVQGDILLNTQNPKESELSTIRVNARTLKTDNSSRNAAIGRAILKSDQDQYEYIEFKPTSFDGLPESITVGVPFSFKINGNLSIAGTVKPVIFDVTVTQKDKELSGTGETTVQYKDFGITIPSVPFVASVENDVKLKINFVADEI